MDTTGAGRLKKKSLIALVVVVAVLLLAAISVLYNRLPAKSNFALNMQQVRELASAPQNTLPKSINSLLVAEGDFPSCLVIAGCAPQSYPFQFRVFEIDYDGKTVIIDPVHDIDLHRENKPLMTEFYPQRYDQMQQAMKKAALIVFTHEHFDHIGGLVKSPYLAELLPKVRANKEQLTSAAAELMDYPPLMQEISLLPDEPYSVLAPGIVVIRSPGHTPGSQMLFVKLRSGEEVLFVGDVVWDMDNILQQKSKSLLTNWIVSENGQQLADQIRALIELYQSDDQVKLLVSHDKDQLTQYLREGLIKDGLAD